jgi:RNA polymerase sigma factor (sigma-70 family)
MVEHARLLADSGQSRQDVVKRLARSMNRSVETVRSTIKRYDLEHPESPLFGGPESTLTENLRNRIYRQYCRGASIATLATSLQRPVAQIQRIINQMRAERVLELPLEYVDSAEFSNEDAETTLLGPMPQPEHVPRRPRAPSGLPPYLASLYQFPLLTKDQEVHLFRKYNFAKYRASQLREGLDPKRPSAKLLTEIERLYRLAIDTKNHIMQTNLRLVVAIVKKRGSAIEDFHERISDGNISLMKALESFDYTRGFKFSTYATWAITRNFAGNYVRQAKRADRYRTGHEEVLDATPGYRANPYAEEAAQERRETVVGKILDCLDSRERGVIERRFGLGQGNEPQTLQAIGDDLRVSKERVRQIETRAIGKLREAVGDDKLKSFVESIS